MSELHSRLSHLVNYSSQLIFVSGDSMADQQRTLSDFLSSQQDNTEISFFSASSEKQATDYRGAICRQLGGHEVGSFIRPLQQLLSDPTHGLGGTGPYLVCITKAETLDPAFLQELWDWVMHSQKDNKDIHLNVILFGESAWAKSSQEWLPIQNSHKPVLLSSESVNPVGFDVNALEALMADKSSWFSTSNQPIVTNKWFIGSVLSVFLVVFIGLMAWQYPNQISSILSGNTELEKSIDESATIEPVMLDASTENARQAIVNIDTSNNNEPLIIDSEVQAYQPLIEVVEPSIDEDLFAKNADPESDDQPTSVTKKLLVSSWSDSVLASNNKPDETITIGAVNKLANTSIENLIDRPISGLSEGSPSDQDMVMRSANQDGDFQVPDIISVEQLDAELSKSSLQDITIDFVPEESELQIIPPNEQQIAILDESAIDYRFDETTLLSLPMDSIVLQLSGIQNPSVLENYLKNNNMKASTWVYETQRYGGAWYVVLYREAFDSIEAALNQLSNLPDDVREAEPFAKSINQIQQEINRR